MSSVSFDNNFKDITAGNAHCGFQMTANTHITYQWITSQALLISNV